MSEIEELRAEVARLRKELDELKARGMVVNHYHYSPLPTFAPVQVTPYYPGGPDDPNRSRRVSGYDMT